MIAQKFQQFPVVLWIAVFLALLQPCGNDTRADETRHAGLERWTGDFEAMLERRRIRALVVYSKLNYFLDGANQHGFSYDLLQEFEKFINETYKTGSRKMTIVYIPTTRDKIASYLNEGIGDVAVANLTITPTRLEQYDFSDPVYPGVREILITGPASPVINSLSDLSGQAIPVRPSSSYYGSLEKLNEKLEADGLEPVRIIPMDENLEDEDLIEMVSAGLLPMVVADDFKADFWGTVFDNLKIRHDIAFTDGENIGWGFRKNSPEFAKAVNQFVSGNKKGTLIGNTLFNRYLRNNKWVNNALAEEEVARLEALKTHFQTFGETYDFDWLMLAALGYQESRLDQTAVSQAGALGVMQLLQSTASDPNVGISDISTAENNIHAGTRYLRFLRDRYFDDPNITPANQTLLSFASYNAGPARIASIRKQASEQGLDPNVWFGNVEYAVAKEIGRETVQYVSNIYKYYIAYKLLVGQRGLRAAAKSGLSESLQQ